MTHQGSPGLLVGAWADCRRQSQVISFALSDPDIQRGCGVGSAGAEVGQRHLHASAPALVPRPLGVDPCAHATPDRSAGSRTAKARRHRQRNPRERRRVRANIVIMVCEQPLESGLSARIQAESHTGDVIFLSKGREGCTATVLDGSKRGSLNTQPEKASRWWIRTRCGDQLFCK